MLYSSACTDGEAGLVSEDWLDYVGDIAEEDIRNKAWLKPYASGVEDKNTIHNKAWLDVEASKYCTR